MSTTPTQNFFDGQARTGAGSFTSPDSQLLDALDISFREHQICMTIPPGSKFDGIKYDLPGGIVIFGAMRGDLRCARGSIIVAAGGYFQGNAEAENFICEGTVGSPVDSSGKLLANAVSSITARGKPAEVEGAANMGGVAAFSARSVVVARIKARAFQVNQGANMNQALLQQID